MYDLIKSEAGWLGAWHCRRAGLAAPHHPYNLNVEYKKVNWRCTVLVVKYASMTQSSGMVWSSREGGAVGGGGP